jgi:hypothetical protein
MNLALSSWPRTFRKGRSLSTLLVAALLLGLAGWTGAAAADREGGPGGGDDRIVAAREEAGRLEEKARRLKQEGHQEEAKRLMGEVEEIRAKVRDFQAQRGPGAPEAERRDIERALEQARAQRRELSEAGKEDQAREVEQRIDKLERRREELAPMPGPSRPRPGPREAREARGAREGRPPMEPRPPEAERRNEHLRIAAEHLHAAGLHDVAERIARQAAQEPREFVPRRAGNPAPEPRRSGERRMAREPMIRPEGEIQDLRNALSELQQSLERVERALREGRDERR